MKRKLPYAAILAGLAMLYFLGAKLGLSLSFKYPSASPVWPPAGLSVAAVLLLGYRVWPGILLGAMLANVTNPSLAGAANGSLLAASLGIAIGNTAEALVACFWPDFRRHSSGELGGPGGSVIWPASFCSRRALSSGATNGSRHSDCVSCLKLQRW
jgi:integral membrane sensor domain MASE1